MPSGVCFQQKKHYPIETGRVMRERYEFKEVLNNVLFGSERSLCTWLFCFKNNSWKASSGIKDGTE